MALIKELTICLNCGNSQQRVKEQIMSLKEVGESIDLRWNNRIDRVHTDYDSFSEMLNVHIDRTRTEFLVVINDRVDVTPHDIWRIIRRLEHGYAAVSMYNMAILGFSKSLIARIGWFDERYIGGGYEDDEFVMRMRLANLAYYECQSAFYYEARRFGDLAAVSDKRPRVGLGCSLSYPHFISKWKIGKLTISQRIQEEAYADKYSTLEIDQEVARSWKSWRMSRLGMDCWRLWNGHTKGRVLCFIWKDGSAVRFPFWGPLQRKRLLRMLK